jgi:dienelactone hydrolase
MKLKRRNSLWLALFCVLSLMIQVGCDNSTSVCSSNIKVSNTSAATLYYPCAISEPLPATTLMSGHAASHLVLAWLAEAITENGFVVLAMTPTDPFGMNSGFRDAHLSGIAKLESLNSENGVLQNKIDIHKLQVCGHSKGGGGALWASAILGSKLKSTIAMAPWKEEFTSLDGIQAATLIQTGAEDEYVTYGMTQAEYNMLPKGISKALFEYSYADHFSWGIFNFGALHGILGADIIAWMQYYLKNDISQRSQLLDLNGKSTHIWEDNSSRSAKSPPLPALFSPIP